jgi:Holliday junction DNA helicase RuvB
MYENNIAEETKKIDSTLRPQSFESYIGQSELIDKLQVAIQAAKERKDPVCSILLGGPSGTGKTTLANIIANEYGSDFRSVMAPSIKGVGDILKLLTKLEPNSFLFIDEIHALDKKADECLYTAVEDFKATIKIANKDIVHIDIAPFCLIGATTDIGYVSEPLRNRFGIIHILQNYTDEEMCQIVTNSIDKLTLAVSSDEVYMNIAKRCRGIPRLANRILARIRDYIQINNNNVIDVDSIEEAMMLEGIDQEGFTKIDKDYLDTLYNNFNTGPAGITSIASSLLTDRTYLEQSVEPYLLKKSLIIKTKSGRALTSEGIKYILNHA